MLERASFEVRDIDHPRVARYQPTYLGHGSDHFVYDVVHPSNAVVKVAIGSVFGQIDRSFQEGTKINNLSSEDRARMRQTVESENRRIEQLREYFGQEHVPSTTKHLLKVPVSENVLRVLYQEMERPLPPTFKDVMEGDIWAVVALQQRVPELRDTSRLSPFASYGDLTDRGYQQEYERVTDAFVCHPQRGGSINGETFTTVHPDLRGVVEKARDDVSFRQTLADFTKRAMAYSSDTGQILDLANPDNVIFYQDTRGQWQYKLVDALPPQAEPQLERARQSIRDKMSGGPVSNDPALVFALTYTRVINGLSRISGLNTFLPLVPDGIDIEPWELWDPRQYVQK